MHCAYVSASPASQSLVGVCPCQQAVKEEAKEEAANAFLDTRFRASKTARDSWGAVPALVANFSKLGSLGLANTASRQDFDEAVVRLSCEGVYPQTAVSWVRSWACLHAAAAGLCDIFV